MKFPIPDFLRPYVSKLAVTAIVSVGALIGSKLGSDPVISPETATKVVEFAWGWLTLTAGHTVISAKTNPTNSATGDLAKTVPAAVLPKADLKQGMVEGIGPTYTPKPGDRI